MKLVRIHIENFGGLRDFSMDFSDGLNVLHQPNGFGKTTLAEFIRAMLYGFPRQGKTLDKSPRRKYAPWQGGRFGGSLIFEVQGSCYRVERTFGTTPKGDSFALFDLTTGRKSNRFSEDLGQELFGIDAESYERSTYLPQQRLSGGVTTAGIQGRLSAMVEQSEDAGCFDRAWEALRSARSGYIPYRGSGGTVAEARTQVSRLQEELEQALVRKNAQEGEEQKIQDLETQLNREKLRQRDLRERICRASEAASVLLAHREYARLVREMTRLQEERATLADSEEQSSRLEELERYFAPGIPGAAELAQCREDLAAARSLREKRAGLLTELAAEPGRGPLGLLLWAFGLLLAAAGGVLLWQGMEPWGMGLLAAGVLCLIAGTIRSVCAARRRKRVRRGLLENAEEAERDALSRERSAAAFIRRYTLAPALTEGFQEIRENREEYIALWERQTGREEKHRGISARMEELSREMAAFRGRYGRELAAPVPEQPEDLTRLHREESRISQTIEALTERLSRARQRRERLAEEVRRIPVLREELEQWQTRYHSHRENARLLDDTMAYLRQARENLRTNYLEPVKQHFAGYMAQLAEEQPGSILVTPELEVQLERAGQVRELRYFSAGQADLVMLCMRFALVDALFREEQPILILDDPFVNLDDAHVEEALALLGKLAREKQILYLACSVSRLPE